MKKHLFLIASVFFAFSAKAQHTLAVKKNTNVKVSSNTLFYVKGNTKLEAYDDNGKTKLSNLGNIKIEGTFENGNVKDGSNFVNAFDEKKPGNYGQLIISGNKGDNSGFISSEVKFNKAFTFHPLSLPYSGIDAKHVVEEIWSNVSDVESAFIGYHKKIGDFDPTRYQNPLLFWNNGRYRFDILDKGASLGAADNDFAKYYAVSAYSKKLKKFNTSSKTSLSGVPVSKTFTVSLTGYHVSSNTAANEWGEVYGTYISDFTKELPNGWKTDLEGKGVSSSGFGDNIFYLGNPYTSNINLKKVLDDAKGVIAVAQFGKQSYDERVNAGKASNAFGKEMSAATGQGTGDEEFNALRPLETFVIKTEGDVTLTFDDSVKDFNAANGKTNNVLYKRERAGGRMFAQVGVDLYENKDGEDLFTGQKAYVVASNVYSKGEEATELYNVVLKDENIGIYTEQEGDSANSDKVYVNAIDADKYIAKPVKLVMQNADGAKYAFKVRLNEDAKNSSNSFYFEDKKSGQVKKIDENFVYEFTSNGTEKDRFVIYWAATPKTNSVVDEVKEAVNNTLIFKSGTELKVRFDKAIKKADVYVYSLSGQLVSVNKDIDAAVDYVLPVIGNSTVYIVKVVGDNGSVVTKKIIK